MKINWKIRLKNPVWWMQMLLAVAMPILAYFGLTVQDLTSWSAVLDVFVSAISNPYVIGLAVVTAWNAINDPTTTGAVDSDRAMNYTTLGGK